jgi:excisionase family DNA binding protein
MQQRVMKKYLSISDIAQITNKERSTVFRWIKAGKLGQVRKVGNEYQVPHESFEMWWNANVQWEKPGEGET